MHKLFFLLVLISFNFSQAQTRKEKIFEESYNYAQKTVATAIQNLSLKMKSDSEYNIRNQDILQLYKKVELAMQTQKQSVTFAKEDGFDYDICAERSDAIANTQLWKARHAFIPQLKKRKALGITVCDVFFDLSLLQRANTIIHEFLHFVAIDEECATDIQTNLIFYFAGLPPQKDGYYGMCEFESFYSELNRKLRNK